MVGRRVLVGVAMLIALASAAPANAQETSPPAEAAAPAPLPDTVVLRNGGFFRGQVTEIVPGDHVTISVGGAPKNIAWSEVDRLVLGAGPGVPPTILRADGQGSNAPPAPGGTAPSPPPSAATPAKLETPPVDAPPQTRWQANRPLLVTGAVLFAGGYGPNLVAAAPSTVGLAGRVALLVLLLGLPCWFGGSGYVCEGSHGAVQLLIPFAGPFLFAADHPRDSVLNERGRPLDDVPKALLYVSGGMQIAGLAAVLGSLVFGGQQPVPGRKRADTTSPSVFVLPQTGAGVLGLTVGVQRW